MIMRAMGLGFLLWLAATLVFRFAGQYFFLPDESARLILFVATPFAVGLTTFLCLRLLNVAPGDEGEGALGLAIPGMLLDAFITHEFGRVLPNLDPTLDGAFGALMLLGYGAILFTGLLMTRLAPQDERV
jgi:hypothetical protein